MRRQRVPRDTVVLTPLDEESLTIGVQAAPDGGINTVITIQTATLGNFLVPLSASQVAVLAVVGRRLLSLTEPQANQLRAELDRASHHEGEPQP